MKAHTKCQLDSANLQPSTHKKLTVIWLLGDFLHVACLLLAILTER